MIKTIKYTDITRQSYIANRHVRSFAVSLIKYIAKNVFNYANSRSSVDYSRPPVDICKHNGCTVNHPRPANQRIHSLLKRFTTCCPDVFATRLFFPNRGHGDISWRHGRSSQVRCVYSLHISMIDYTFDLSFFLERQVRQPCLVTGSTLHRNLFKNATTFPTIRSIVNLIVTIISLLYPTRYHWLFLQSLQNLYFVSVFSW